MGSLKPVRSVYYRFRFQFKLDPLPVPVPVSVFKTLPSSDVLELIDVLYVPSLTKNLLSVSAMIDLRCVAEFYDKQVIIVDRNRKNGQVLAKGV
jgi:hypothetical protein